ncbi:MAG TPA: Spy/CpxP family protein refolding chaperone [Acetobacteraceae bacterium]|jgi:protein CpxP|nr:Spy/CpxP family protein refolding chaperone [Acetobacteraceae bacterium]
MNTLHKSLIIAITTLGLGTVAVAAPDQVAPAPATSWHSDASGQHGEKFAERMAKRQAKLHDKLALTPAQEAAWQVFTAKMQATVLARSDARPAAPLTAPERAERKAAFLQVAQQQAASRVQPIKDFYAVLSPEQQKIFDSQFQGHHHHFGHH